MFALSALQISVVYLFCGGTGVVLAAALALVGVAALPAPYPGAATMAVAETLGGMM